MQKLYGIPLLDAGYKLYARIFVIAAKLLGGGANCF